MQCKKLISWCQVFILTVFINALLVTSLSGAEQLYTRATELPPIKMGYSDLQDSLDRASKIIFEANTQHDIDKYISESITFDANDTKIEISGHSFLPSGIKLPKRVYYVFYEYRHSDAPISGVKISLSDYSRTLTVSGKSPEQIDALSAMLTNDLMKFSSNIGGSWFRMVLGLIKFILIALVAILTLYCVVEKRIRLIGIPIFLLIILICLYSLPFDDILSGFAIYSGDSSIFIRYGPQMTFWGVIVTIIGIPLSYLLPKWLSSSKKA